MGTAGVETVSADDAGSYRGRLGNPPAPRRCTRFLQNYIILTSRSAETNQLCGSFMRWLF